MQLENFKQCDYTNKRLSQQKGHKLSWIQLNKENSNKFKQSKEKLGKGIKKRKGARKERTTKRSWKKKAGLRSRRKWMLKLSNVS